jgi:hypothetical protein
MLNAILLFFGAMMLWAGWQTLKEQRRLLKQGVRTEARVIEVKETTYKGRPYFRPVWAFQDEAGNEYPLSLARSSEGSTSRNRWRIGDTKWVIYDPNSPDRVHGVGAKQNVGIAIYLLVSLGLIGYVVADMTGLIG